MVFSLVMKNFRIYSLDKIHLLLNEQESFALLVSIIYRAVKIVLREREGGPPSQSYNPGRVHQKLPEPLSGHPGIVLPFPGLV